MICQVRDPVHGFVSLSEKELQIVNAPLFQRLRRIHQLALASLVYPGALHTRFDHSLGVMHVGGTMARTLGLAQDETNLVRQAALVHDLGHGPFSHVSEHALDLFADRTTLGADQKKEKIHELVTALLIRNDPDLERVLGSDSCEKICRLLGPGYGEPILHSVVSGPLDADKQDYLLRDSLFCGVQYGVFDLHQLHRSLTSYGNANGRQLMIKQDGIHAVEQYALAKYYLTSNVYRHKVRLITDQMIVRAIVLGYEKDRLKEMIHLYRFDNTPRFASHYSQWDDSRFFNEFAVRGKQSSKCAQMLRRLLDRRLFKRVFSARPTEFSPTVRDRLLSLVEPGQKAVRAQIEGSLAEAISSATNNRVEPDDLILHTFNIKSVKETSRDDDAGILVAKSPNPVGFQDESVLFRSISEGFNEEFVEIYAPMAWQTQTEKDHTRAMLKEKIRATIEKGVASGREGEGK